MKKRLHQSLIIIAFISFAFLIGNAQVAGFVSSPGNRAIDSIVNHATLFPRMTTERISVIAIPTTNLVVFNTDKEEYEYNAGTPAKPDWKAASPDFLEELNLGATLLPRMSTEQRNSISNPAAGLTIFNTDTKKYNYNSGTPAKPEWKPIK